MKIKSIITAIVVIGVVTGGSIYFMNSHTASANPKLETSSNSTNTTTSNLNNTGTTSSTIKANTTENIKPINSNNQESAPNNKNITAQSNQNNTNQTSHQTKTQNSTSTPKSSNMIKSTGNFSDIINNTKYMSGSIDGTTIIIPFNNAHIVNKQLILPEYYSTKLNETFTDKISSTGNGNFVVYEYYGNKNTAVMNLKYHNNQFDPSLSGTFKHVGSNTVTGIKFGLITEENAGPLQYPPFYHTTIGGTSVNITTDSSIGIGTKYLEYYAGNPNTFNLSIDYDLSSNYRIGLLETYNGKKTGEYLLNPVDSNDTFTNAYSGVFITKPNTPQSKTYNVTLTGNYSPNQN